MPKQRSPDSYKAEELYRQGKKLVEIASQLSIPEGTVRRWKSTYKWDTERSDKKSERSHRKNKKKEEVFVEEVDHVMENPDLTDKQRLFCVYYVRSFNATKAYQKAYGCSYEIAMVNGSRLLRNAKIKKEIEELKQNRLNREFFSEEDVFQKYMDIAFSDITDYVTFGTEEAPVMTMYGPAQVKDEETGEKKNLMKTINVVRFKESANVDGTLISEVKQGRDGASIKLLDKMKALEWLADHMDMATEEQRTRIAALKAKIPEEDSGTADDGFLEALKGLVNEVWEE